MLACGAPGKAGLIYESHLTRGTTARAPRAPTTVRFGGNFPENPVASPNPNTPATTVGASPGHPLASKQMGRGTLR